MCAKGTLNYSMASTAKWIMDLRQSIKKIVEQVGQSEVKNPKENYNPGSLSIPRQSR